MGVLSSCIMRPLPAPDPRHATKYGAGRGLECLLYLTEDHMSTAIYIVLCRFPGDRLCRLDPPRVA